MGEVLAVDFGDVASSSAAHAMEFVERAAHEAARETEVSSLVVRQPEDAHVHELIVQISGEGFHVARHVAIGPAAQTLADRPRCLGIAYPGAHALSPPESGRSTSEITSIDTSHAKMIAASVSADPASSTRTEPPEKTSTR